MAERGAMKGEVSGERLLQVAAHLFRQRGYLATNVREIARAANMKSGSIYYHYPSKEALLEAVMNRAIFELTAAVQSALSALPAPAAFRDRLHAAVAAHLKAIHEYGDFVIASRQSIDMLPEGARSQHLRLRRQYAEVWTEMFEEGRRSGEVRAKLDTFPVQMFIFGALNWTSEWLDPKRLSYEQTSKLLTDFALSGVAVESPAKTAAATSHRRARRSAR
jgi:AcrR family transcriptional regulator